MAQVSEVRTVNAAWLKSKGKKPSSQQKNSNQPSNHPDSSPTAASDSNRDDAEAPPHIDEFV